LLIRVPRTKTGVAWDKKITDRFPSSDADNLPSEIIDNEGQNLDIEDVDPGKYVF
jgi:hypothetical protein